MWIRVSLFFVFSGRGIVFLSLFKAVGCDIIHHAYVHMGIFAQ